MKQRSRRLMALMIAATMTAGSVAAVPVAAEDDPYKQAEAAADDPYKQAEAAADDPYKQAEAATDDPYKQAEAASDEEEALGGIVPSADAKYTISVTEDGWIKP